jgi:plastocyanin
MRLSVACLFLGRSMAICGATDAKVRRFVPPKSCVAAYHLLSGRQNVRFQFGLCIGLVAALTGGCARFGAVEAARRSLNADALVTMSGFEFMPRHITIKAGQSVEWNNTAALETHTVTADPSLAKAKADVALPPAAEPFNSGSLKPGETFRHTFAVPSTYRYFCIPHEQMGMIGEVEVLAGS